MRVLVKFLLLTFILIALPGFIQGQDFQYDESVREKIKEERLDYFGAMGFTAGMAIPLNHFGESDIFNRYAGYAQRGFSFNPLNVHYRFSKFYGIQVNYTGSILPFNADGFADALTGYYNSINYKAEADDWMLHNFSVGFMASVPHEVFDLDFRLMLSAVNANMPEIRYQVSDYRNNGIGSYEIVQEAAQTTDLGFSLGMTARFHVHKSIDFFLQAEYFHSKPVFEVDYVYSFGVSSTDQIENPIYVLSLSPGIGFRF